MSPQYLLVDERTIAEFPLFVRLVYFFTFSLVVFARLEIIQNICSTVKLS